MQKNQWKIYGGILLASFSTAVHPKTFILGFFVSLTSLFTLVSLFQEEAPLFLYRDLAIDFLREHLILVIPIAITVFSGYVFSKMTLIRSLDTKKHQTIDNTQQIFPAFLVFEALYFFSIFAIAGILLIPTVLTMDNPTLSTNLYALGMIVFLPIFLIALFMEVCGSFYLLFSKTNIRSAYELAYSLFVNHIATITVFGTLFTFTILALTLITGSLYEFLHHIIPNHTIFLLGVIYFFQAYLTAFSKAAWYGLFRFIADTKTKEKTSQESENVLQQEVPQTNS